MSNDDTLLFLDRHEPPLEAGVYEVSVSQTVGDTGGRIPNVSIPRKVARFHVEGPKVALQPNWIDSRFPPTGSAGDHAGVLPHIALRRSTLPWERDAVASGASSTHPWPAVLLFKVDELTDCVDQQLPVKALRDSSSNPTGPDFPGLGSGEKGFADDEQVRVLDAPRSILERTLPGGTWLSSLVHVRERLITQLTVDDKQREVLDNAELPDGVVGVLASHGCAISIRSTVEVEMPGREWRIYDPDGERRLFLEANDSGIDVADQRRAVVMSCRTAVSGERYRAYLVSLEQRYTASLDFDFGSALAPTDRVRLVVLDSWDFSVDQNAGRLEHLLKGLFKPKGGRGPLDLTVPLETLRGPGVNRLRAGYALLPHRLRNSGTIRSWYRGPFIAVGDSFASAPILPTNMSDSLLRMDESFGILDTSRAAAWELGRQLTLANTDVALDIQQWKTANKHRRHKAGVDDDHLGQSDPGPLPVPTSVALWLQRLAVLDGIPFGYLVADPEVLPPESLKILSVDQYWIDCVLDGAFSSGRVLAGDKAADAELWGLVRTTARKSIPQTGPGPSPLSGLLIRSEVVSGWPDLQIDIFGTSGIRNTVLRRVRLSDNVLLVLVVGQIRQIDLHPNPEALHHGLLSSDGTPQWSFPRGSDGKTVSNAPGSKQTGVTVLADDRVDVEAAVRNGALSPREFAIQTIAGVPKVTITVA